MEEANKNVNVIKEYSMENEVTCPETEQLEEKVQAENDNMYIAKMNSKIQGGISWFFSIAGLSVLNTIIYLTGGNWNFIIGFGITQIIDDIAVSLQGAGMVITGIISVVIAGGFALLGLLAKKKTRSWVFMVGIIIYSIDTIIFILGADWVGIGFHIWGIYGFTAAFIACNKLKRFTIKQ